MQNNYQNFRQYDKLKGKRAAQNKDHEEKQNSKQMN